MSKKNSIPVLITGANGQLGKELVHAYKNSKDYYILGMTRQQLDITDYSKIENFICKHQIQLVINTAAYTSVDKAEKEKEVANLINFRAVSHLAKLSKQIGFQLIHISTDYVFDGKNHSPYKETDTPNPLSVYGSSKLAGENAIKEIAPKNAIILRTSWLYSKHGNNFLKTMLKIAKTPTQLRIVADQIGSPTYARDIAGIIKVIVPKINNPKPEIYHYTNEGTCSWYDFSKSIFEYSKINCDVEPITSKSYPQTAKRPLYSVLNKEKIKLDFQFTIPYWQDSLKECLIDMNTK